MSRAATGSTLGEIIIRSHKKGSFGDPAGGKGGHLDRLPGGRIYDILVKPQHKFNSFPAGNSWFLLIFVSPLLAILNP
jgi:hypothetical protein